MSVRVYSHLESRDVDYDGPAWAVDGVELDWMCVTLILRDTHRLIPVFVGSPSPSWLLRTILKSWIRLTK